jgi:inner membrane protein
VWHGVVETRALFALAEVRSLGPEVDPGGSMEVRYKPQETPMTLAAKRSYLGRAYLDWAKFPITETESTADGGYVVHFYDLRFEQAFRSSARKPLSAGVVLDSNLDVVTEFMGSLSKPAPD